MNDSTPNPEPTHRPAALPAGCWTEATEVQKMPNQSEGRYFLAWLVFTLAAALGGGLCGALAGVTLAVLLANSGFSPEQLNGLYQLGGFVAALPASYLSFRLIVDKMLVRYRP